LRDQLRRELARGWRTARDLSGAVRLSEKAVYEHLEHLRRSDPDAFEIDPAACLACEFTFASRRRINKPGRCPRCRAERIEPPRFRWRE
jgi:hypothetical protein